MKIATSRVKAILASRVKEIQASRRPALVRQRVAAAVGGRTAAAPRPGLAVGRSIAAGIAMDRSIAVGIMGRLRPTGVAPAGATIPAPPPPAAVQAEAILTGGRAAPVAVPLPSDSAVLAPFPAVVPETPEGAVTEADLQATRDETAEAMAAVEGGTPKPAGIAGPLAAGAAGFFIAGPIGAAVGLGAAFLLRKKE
jgi:hypothetical protein